MDLELEFGTSMRKLVIAAISVLAVAVLLVAGYECYILRTAESLLADVKALKLGESSFEEASGVAAKYARFRVVGWGSVPASQDPRENNFPGDICSPDRCLFAFAVNNLSLYPFHIVRCTEFSAEFAVLNGKVQYADVHLHGGPECNYGGFVEEVNPRDDVDHKAYSFRTPVGKPYLRISLTQQAPTALRDRAFALNMHCMIAMRGCDEPCDYLPLLWNDWKADLADKGGAAVLKTTYPRCP